MNLGCVLICYLFGCCRDVNMRTDFIKKYLVEKLGLESDDKVVKLSFDYSYDDNLVFTLSSNPLLPL